MNVQHGPFFDVLFHPDMVDSKGKPISDKQKKPIKAEYVEYSIPVFQRQYAWDKENCKELFDDIVDATKSRKNHFLGTMVRSVEEIDETKKKIVYTIIDGQQRITTVFLLLRALSSLSSGEEKDYIDSCLYNESSEKNYKKYLEKDKLKLKENGSDDEKFRELMLDSNYNSSDKSNIIENYKFLLNQISESGLSVSQLLEGIELLFVVAIDLEEGDEPQVVFERINSTGKDLELCDKIRNCLLMNEPKLNTLYRKYWRPIEKSLVFNDNNYYLNEYFKDYLRFKSDEHKKNEPSYRNFKRYLSDNELTNEEALKDLLYYSKYYCAFISKDFNGSIGRGKNAKKLSSKTLTLLDNIRSTNQTTIYPFLFRVFDDYVDNHISETTLNDALSFFLNYLIRRTIIGGTDSLRGFFIDLYDKIFLTHQRNNKNYMDRIYAFFARPSTRITNDKFPSDKDFKDKLKTKKLYKTCPKPLLNFLLRKIEEVGSGRPPKDLVQHDKTVTIEHIMPQRIDEEKTDWKQMQGDKFQYTHETYLDTLGNLSLATENAELSNSSFTVKKEQYYTKTLGFNFLYSYVKKQKEWTEKQIVQRAEKLSNVALKEFNTPEKLSELLADSSGSEEISIYWKKVKYDRVKLVSYSFLDKSYKCKDLKKMYNKVLEMLWKDSDENKKNIEQMAVNSEIFGKRKTPVLSKSVKTYKQPVQILDTGIYSESELSSNDLIRQIKDIFSQLNTKDKKYDLILTIEQGN